MENTAPDLAPFTAQAKYADWLEKYTFDNCLLKRGEYGEFLADYITAEHDGFVLNLNGGWGSGKTEFLKRFYTLLLNRNHPVIYIDAWESDFSKDPLTVVTSELLTQLEAFNYGLDSIEDVEKFKKLCGRFIKGVAVGVSAYLSKKYLDDASILSNSVQQAISGEPESLLTALSKEHQELVSAIQQIRITLGEVAGKLTGSGVKLPVVVLVDELDRCRPNYAIEMLEVIKHFFKTDNFVFVVATDTEQLVHSISAVYGAGFDAAQYLKRFFDRKAALPTSNILRYIDTKQIFYDEYDTIKFFPISLNMNNVNMAINWHIALLSIAYDLKIRDIDQLINRLQSCLRSIKAMSLIQKKTQIISIPALIIGLIEFDKNFPSYRERNEDNKSFQQAKHKGRMDNPSDIFFDNDQFKLDQYIQLSMELVNFKDDRRKTNSFEQLSYLVTPIFSNAGEGHNLTPLGNETIGVMDFLDNDAFHFWHWKAYKKVIELAGNIE